MPLAIFSDMMKEKCLLFFDCKGVNTEIAISLLQHQFHGHFNFIPTVCNVVLNHRGCELITSVTKTTAITPVKLVAKSVVNRTWTFCATEMRHEAHGGHHCQPSFGSRHTLSAVLSQMSNNFQAIKTQNDALPDEIVSLGAFIKKSALSLELKRTL